jgi:hypothetical protein
VLTFIDHTVAVWLLYFYFQVTLRQVTQDDSERSAGGRCKRRRVQWTSKYRQGHCSGHDVPNTLQGDDRHDAD